MTSLISKPGIVIGGCARSGTSLMLAVLSTHPDVFGLPFETSVFVPNDSKIQAKRRQKVENFLWDHYSEFCSCLKWVEKTPRNCQYYKEILKQLPDVNIINMVRDGRDVLTSIHPDQRHKGYYVKIGRWVKDVTSGKKMELHKRVLSVRYEDLVLDFPQTMNRICFFLDLNSDVDWQKRRKVTESDYNYWQGNPETDLFTSSIGRWKDFQYQKEVEPLMENDVAMSLLQHYGYEKEV